MPLLAAVATVVLVVFLLWFAVGTQRNISRGNNLLRWLQDGLGDLGPRTTLKWRGSSVAQLDIVGAVAPFADAQINVVLEPRDVAWLWAWSHQRGRRDLLILRGTFSQDVAPSFAVEVGGSRAAARWVRRAARSSSDEASATAWEDAAGAVDVTYAGEVDLTALRKSWAALGEASGGACTLSIAAPPLRVERHHIEVHVEAPDAAAIGALSSKELIGVFRDLANLAAPT